MDQVEPGPGDEPKAKVELLLPKTTFKPGETIAVGVKFTMQPGWHIYWINPGDSGQGPTFGWNLPGGGASRMLRGAEWKATDPQFPTPERIVSDSGAINYGYSGTVIFPATITVPASTVPGQSVEVAMGVNYLVCKDICLAESAVLQIEVDVGSDVSEDNAQIVKALKAADATVPVAADRAGDVQVIGFEELSGKPRRVRMTVEMPAGVKNVEFFPNPSSKLSVENIEVETDGQEVTFTFDVRTLAGSNSTTTAFPAVIGYNTSTGERRGVEVNIPSKADAS